MIVLPFLFRSEAIISCGRFALEMSGYIKGFSDRQTGQVAACRLVLSHGWPAAPPAYQSLRGHIREERETFGHVH